MRYFQPGGGEFRVDGAIFRLMLRPQGRHADSRLVLSHGNRWLWRSVCEKKLDSIAVPATGHSRIRKNRPPEGSDGPIRIPALHAGHLSPFASSMKGVLRTPQEDGKASLYHAAGAKR
jgi:hypothetical protein